SKNPLKKAYLKNLAGRIERYEEEWWPQYDLLLPITDSDAQVIQERLSKQPMLTAPFGINTANIPVKKKEYWHGYHIGAMDWLPNQEAVRWFVKEVWPELRIQVPDFSFYYAGRNMPDEFYHYATMGVHCEGEVDNAQEFI